MAAQEGATVPFMARYRKERTGNLDEVQIQLVLDAQEEWDTLLKRQKFIVSEIDKQGKLNPELTKQIFSTFRLEILEDLYLPYKIKKKTKAVVAKEAGLEPLADILWDLGHGVGELGAQVTLEALATPFVITEKGVKDVPHALQGVQDILTERLAESKELRELTRKNLFERGFVMSKKTDKAKVPSKYENYFDYYEEAASLADPKNSHRYLALRRAWMEEEISVTLGTPDPAATWVQDLEESFVRAALTKENSLGAEILKKAARLALKAYVYPSIENEVHKALKAVADSAAIDVFADNVKNLLLASPFGAKAVLGVDPGIRTGCKLAVVDAAGAYKIDAVVHLHSDAEKAEAAKLFEKLVKDSGIAAIAVGNGTAGRETERFIREALKTAGLSGTPVVMVNESGASIYSASEIARQEFPNLDLTVRGAISIARRLQDPLAELVKVDPKSIGVGQYQHDVAPALLKKSLENTVDYCVNRVGVNLNTASEHLLSHVAGIGPSLAKSILEHRAQVGLFKKRDDLLKVPRFSKNTFEQAAGFLRIPNADYPLDNTGIHPERYGFLESLAKNLSKEIKDLLGPEGVKYIRGQSQELAKLREELGEFTFQDILTELEKPGRDPRESFVPFAFRDDIFELKDLKSGMLCPGIVTNVANFGAFVDIGVHQDGLVHISQISDRFVKDPRELVKPGDQVKVRVLEVNLEKKQISLSMKSDPAELAAAAAAEAAKREADFASRRNAAPLGGRGGASHANPRGGPGAPRSPYRGGVPQGGNRGNSAGPRGPSRDHRSGGADRGPRRDSRDHRETSPRSSAPQKALSSNPFEKLAALKDSFKKS